MAGCSSCWLLVVALFASVHVVASCIVLDVYGHKNCSGYEFAECVVRSLDVRLFQTVLHVETTSEEFQTSLQRLKEKYPILRNHSGSPLVLKSRCRLTYDDVYSILGGWIYAMAKSIAKGSETFVSMYSNMFEVADRLHYGTALQSDIRTLVELFTRPNSTEEPRTYVGGSDALVAFLKENGVQIPKECN